jgi:hypothetical protein
MSNLPHEFMNFAEILNDWIQVGQPTTGEKNALDVALVVEDTTTMVLWERTITELYQLLQLHGAFKEVCRWTLKLESGTLQLRDAAGTPRSLTVLRDPPDRRLVLLVSDCVSPPWYDGTLTATLGSWTATLPVALIQVLPQRLWARTGLGEADLVMRAPYAGCSNRDLVVEQPPWALDAPAGEHLPVMSLDTSSIGTWARMLTIPGVPAPGVVLVGTAEHETVQKSRAHRPPEVLSAPKRVQHFRTLASAEAFDLAVCLSTVPLTLPVMRLVQQTALPQSEQTHLAEMLLGGLVERVTPLRSPVPADQVEFDFHEGVREVLQGSLRVDETLAIYSAVSKYIERETGVTVDFSTLVSSVDGAAVIPDAALPFARIAHQALTRLGLTPRSAGAPRAPATS